MSQHPSHQAQLARLNRVSGQVEGLKKMVDERRYCPEILAQCRAIRAAIKAVEAEIMTTHLGHCVQRALASDEAAAKEKILAEIQGIFRTYSE